MTPRSFQLPFWILSMVIVLTAPPALAQSLKKGTLSGILLSGVGNSAGPPATILTAPATGVTILLKTCAAKGISGQNPLVQVRGSTLGLIASFGTEAIENDEGGRACLDLSPGLVLPHGEQLSCSPADGTATVSCSAAAVFSKK